MKNVVIVYEIFNREFINIAILKCELEKRGYNVIIKNKSEDIFNGKSDLLIVPNTYSTENYNLYCYRFNCMNTKILNLQIEQIHSKKVEDNNDWVAEGLSKDCKFICWGINRKKQLLKAGVRDDSIKITGAMQLDQLKQRFDLLWKTKSELAAEYSIDENKEWLVYFSSLSYASSHSTLINWAKKVDNHEKFYKLYNFHRDTHLAIVESIKYIIENTNNIFIYRPHPTEEISDELKELKRMYPNRLYIILDYNIKQWIKVCDIIISGLSTSLAECYVTNKKTIVYVPVKPIIEADSYFFDGINTINSFEEFKSIIDGYNNGLEIPQLVIKNMERYFDLGIEYSYIKIADYVDEIINYPELKKEKFMINRFVYFCSHHIIIKLILKKFYQLLYKNFNFKIKNSKIRERFFVSKWEESIKNKIELEKMCLLIKNILR